jgi:hypothetical protein
VEDQQARYWLLRNQRASKQSPAIFHGPAGPGAARRGGCGGARPSMAWEGRTADGSGCLLHPPPRFKSQKDATPSAQHGGNHLFANTLSS